MAEDFNCHHLVLLGGKSLKDLDCHPESAVLIFVVLLLNPFDGNTRGYSWW